MSVESVDLHPAPHSGVHQCDWLTVSVQPSPDDDVDNGVVLEAAESPPDAPFRRAVGVRALFFDAVIFSLVLSYMPSSKMRFLACIQAHRVLKKDGLLIIVSTRTQGSRHAPWINDWEVAIETIGFQRVHKDIREKLIGLTFRKTTSLVLSDERANELLATTNASMLTITADSL